MCCGADSPRKEIPSGRIKASTISLLKFSITHCLHKLGKQCLGAQNYDLHKDVTA